VFVVSTMGLLSIRRQTEKIKKEFPTPTPPLSLVEKETKILLFKEYITKRN
jgi:hypothetical protein